MLPSTHTLCPSGMHGYRNGERKWCECSLERERDPLGKPEALRKIGAPSVATATRPAPPSPSPRHGKAAEDAMAALLATFAPVYTYRRWRDLGCPGECWIAQYPVGALLTPTRGFRADFLHGRMLLDVEVSGAAHVAGDKRRRHDVKRTQLLEANGIRVVVVLPEQVLTNNGSEAVAVIARAVGKED